MTHEAEPQQWGRLVYCYMFLNHQRYCLKVILFVCNIFNLPTKIGKILDTAKDYKMFFHIHLILDAFPRYGGLQLR